MFDDDKTVASASEWRTLQLVVCVTVLIGLGVMGIYDIVRAVFTDQQLSLAQVGQGLLVSAAAGVFFGGLWLERRLFARRPGSDDWRPGRIP